MYAGKIPVNIYFKEVSSMFSFKNKQHDQHSDVYMFSSDGMSMINNLKAEQAREKREDLLKARRSKYIASHEDFAKFRERHQSSTPTPPPASVFNGTTDLKVVKPVESEYYKNLYQEVQKRWNQDLQEALEKSRLPEGHPLRLNVTITKL